VSIEDDLAGCEHTACESQRRRVQKYEVDSVGAEVCCGGAGGLEPRRVLVGGGDT
jgi:hypothetical protein